MENLQNYFLNKLEQGKLEFICEKQYKKTSKGFIVYYSYFLNMYFGMYGNFGKGFTDYCNYCFNNNYGDLMKIILKEVKRG